METLNFSNGIVKVGDIFASQWGYEQTNVTFYQVISLHGKQTVCVREIGAYSNYSSLKMTGTKKAKPGEFKGESLKRRVRTYSSVPCIEIESFETAYLSEAEEVLEFTTYY
ncbi:hypothetical protein V7L32_004279 [Salmonella enterica]